MREGGGRRSKISSPHLVKKKHWVRERGPGGEEKGGLQLEITEAGRLGPKEEGKKVWGR